jgi:lactate dehydrogenase-like 2-hydroxyacid dehydrogenase
VIVVPHIASATPETRIRMGDIVVANIKNVLNGLPPETCVNPEVLRS